VLNVKHGPPGTPPLGQEAGHVPLGIEVVASPPSRVIEPLLDIDEDQCGIRRKIHDLSVEGRRDASA
jgi:hypothetical protein